MKELVIYLHDGTNEHWVLGEEFDEFNVADGALVLMKKADGWIAWYNLNDVQKWYIGRKEG